MIIVMQPDAGETEVAAVEARIRAQGLGVHISRGTERTLIGAIGDERSLDPEMFDHAARRRTLDAHRQAVQTRRAGVAPVEHGRTRAAALRSAERPCR